MIQHKRVILVGTPLLLLWGGTHFFLDRGLASLIEKSGTAVNGARVDVGSVSTRFFPPRFVIRRLQVTDAEDPMTNALDIDRLWFSVEGRPLFWKRIIVDRAEITGVRVGTARARSGALAPKSKGEEAPTQKSGSPFPDVGGETKALWGDLSADGLSSYQKIRSERARLEGAAEAWKKQSAAIDTENLKNRARVFSEKVKALPSGLEGAKALPSLASEGKSLLAEVEKARDAQRALQEAIKAESANARAVLAEIERLKSQDVEALVSRAKAGVSAEGLSARLVGPQWMSRVKSGLSWFHKIRTLMPASKKESAPPPALQPGGQDISFPFHHAWPVFHLKSAVVSGVTGGEDPLSYSGTLTDVSSDPALVGRPTVLQLAGGEEKGSRKLSLSATLDATGDTRSEKVQLSITGFPLAGRPLGDLGGPVRMTEGSGRIEARLEARGNVLSGTIGLSAPSVRLEHTPSGGDLRVSAWVGDVLAKVTTAEATVGVAGELTAPRLSLNTTLDNALAQGVKQAFQKQWDDARAEARTKVNLLVDAEKEKWSQSAQAQTEELLKKWTGRNADLDGVKEQVQQALDKTLGGGSKPSLNNLKNIFKKK